MQASRADALEQLQSSQQRARRQERDQMQQLMGELRSWKQQNESRLRQLSSRASQPVVVESEPRSPSNISNPGREESGVGHGFLEARNCHASPSKRSRRSTGWSDEASKKQMPQAETSWDLESRSERRSPEREKTMQQAQQPSLRELQRELQKLKSSLSVYLGS